MLRRTLGWIATLAAFPLSAAVAAPKCQLQQLGVLPVDMQGLHPIVSTKINGVKARFILDSGAFYTLISRSAAAQYRMTPAPGHALAFITSGIGGSERAQVATAASFDFLGVPLPNVRFGVVDQDWGDVAGILGQNLLRVSDVEYDLANGIARFIRPVGCAGQPLAYWAVSTPYSSVDLKYMDAVQSHALATAMVNGRRITVMFDTGASRSLLSLEAAQRLGITPGSPGVTFLGEVSGIGPAITKEWIAPVDTFEIGGEKVEHTHLPIGTLGNAGVDMLLGDDYFLSHRIYVAYSQKKLYFTYNGGPLFNLDVPQAAPGTAKPPPAPGMPTRQASAATGEQSASDAPVDADGFRRRGMARASVREFDQALADLTHACELAPRDADSRYDRGMVFVEDGQVKSALEDFDTAITLQSDDIDAHLARAELLQSHPEVDSADGAAKVKSDLDAISRLLPPTAGLRRTLSALYSKLGDYAAAIDQINQWLSQHPLTGDQFAGLSDRCWLRAMSNQNLDEALDDCNHALGLRVLVPQRNGDLVSTQLAPENPFALRSRALVYLRLGKLEDAVRDFDSALKTNPKMPTSLYGRGLVELRLGEKTQGEGDLAAAQKLDKGVAQLFAKMGLSP